MASEQASESGSGVTDKAAEHFGLVIAYLLPGLAGLWAAAYYSANVNTWMREAATHNTSLGGFLFLMVAAIGAGMAIQALRWAVLEVVLPWMCPKSFCDRWYLRRPVYDEGQGKAPAIQAALNRLRDQHYRYYQSHGGLFVTMPLVYIAWLSHGETGDRAVMLGIGLAILELVLFFAALDAQKRLRIKRIALLRKVA